MPIAKVQKIDSWSVSRYGTYTKCPALAKFKIIQKLPEPDGPALANGARIHQLCELYLKQPKTKLPAELFRFEEEFKHLRKVKASGEESWGFTHEWEPCSPTDWARCWLRIKLDAYYFQKTQKKQQIVYVVDYKTGKEYPDHADQRELYCLGALLMFPDCVKAVGEHWYLEAGVLRPTEYHRDELQALIAKWEKRVQAMLSDTTFAPRPGSYCNNCHYRKANNGPCQY